MMQKGRHKRKDVREDKRGTYKEKREEMCLEKQNGGVGSKE